MLYHSVNFVGLDIKYLRPQGLRIQSFEKRKKREKSYIKTVSRKFVTVYFSSLANMTPLNNGNFYLTLAVFLHKSFLNAFVFHCSKRKKRKDLEDVVDCACSLNILQ